MTAATARHRLSGVRAIPFWAWPLFAATALWSALVVGGYLGELTIPNVPALALLYPLGLAGLMLWSRSPAPAPLKACAAWAAVLAAAFLSAQYAGGNERMALAAPALALAGVVCARYPVPAMVGAFAVTGAYNSIEVFTPVPAHQVVDLLLAGLWAASLWAYLLKQRDRRLWFSPAVVLTLLYLLVTAAQALAADPLQQGLYAFRTAGWYMLAVVLAAYGGLAPAELRKVARGVVAASVLVGGYAVLRWLIGPADAERASAAGSTYNIVDGELRTFGSFQAGHALASWTAPMASFCLAACLGLPGRWRAVALAGAALCTVAVLASEVRAGLLALGVGAVLVLALHQLSRGFPGQRIGITAAAVVAAVAVTAGAFTLAIDTDSQKERYTVLATPEEDPALQRRLQKWNDTIDQVRDRPFGTGLGASGRAHDRYSRFTDLASLNLDNSYLKVVYDQGLFVLILYVAAALALLYTLVRGGLGAGAGEKAAVCVGAAGALSAFLVMSASGMYIEGLPALAVWLVTGLGIGQLASPDSAPA